MIPTWLRFGLLIAVFATPPAASALVVEKGGAETTRPPEDDPGWASVGIRGLSSAVHLRDGWIVTAAHAGVGEVVFRDESLSDVALPDVRSSDSIHTPIPDTTVHLTRSGSAQTDLMMFRVTPTPNLSRLAIHHEPMRFGSEVVMVGFGKGAGPKYEWNGMPGFQWTADAVKRWGTNRVFKAPQLITVGTVKTWCFQTDFSRHGTSHEAQAAFGDSGGAVFTRRKDRWVLAGIMLHVGNSSGQPGSTAIYGNLTNVADLSFYRMQIIQTMRKHATPEAPRNKAP